MTCVVGGASSPQAQKDYAFDLSHVRAFINCSEPCRPAAFSHFLDAFKRHGIRPAMLQTCYAMAETVFAVTQSDLGRPPARLSSILPDFAGRADAMVLPDVLSAGRPIDGIELRLLDDDGADAAAGKVGEISVSAPYLFQGYFRLAAETDAAFTDGWYRTGDLGLLVEDELFVVGRVKDLVIVHGKNLVAHQVEDLVSAVPGIKPGRVVAFGVGDDRAGSEMLVVVAEQSRRCAIPVLALKAAISEQILAATGISPGRTLIVEEGWLAKTTSGKMSREANKARYLAGLQAAG